MASNLPEAPKFSVRNSPSLDKAFRKISEYLGLLRNSAGEVTAKAITDVLQPGYGINIVNSGDKAVVEAQKINEMRQTHYRIFAEVPEEDVTDLVVGPGLLYGGKSPERMMHTYWPGFHAANAAKPDNTKFTGLADGKWEIWGKVTAECADEVSGSASAGATTFKYPVTILEFDIEKYEGVFSDGINSALESNGTTDDLSGIGANVPDDDPDTGVFRFFIGCVKKTGQVVQIYNAVREPVWWWMICGSSVDTSPGDSDPGSPSGSSPSPSSPASGSSKSTAIVEDPLSPTGYTKFYAIEAPEVIFLDFAEFAVKGRRSTYQLDPRFTSLCELEGVKVIVGGDRGWAAGFVRRNSLHVTVSAFPWCRPRVVTMQVIMIRKGFKHVRLGTATEQEFKDNERLLQSLRSGGLKRFP